ncbi:hypothetical protein [Microbacterium sp. NPDC055683]
MTASDDDDLEIYSSRRAQRVRITAWVALIALIATGGGAALFSLLVR